MYLRKKTKNPYISLIVLPPESTKTLTCNSSKPVFYQVLLFFLKKSQFFRDLSTDL